MEITKERLDELQKDKSMRHVAALFGVDLDELIKNAKEELDKREEFKRKEEKIHCRGNLWDILNEMEESGRLKTYEKDGKKYYYYNNIEETPKKKEYEAPKCEKPNFIMNEKQFEEFCEAYRELVDAEKKLNYLFGIEFNDSNSGFGFSSKAREIIWNLLRIIFGEENLEDIASYLYGDSHFDSPKALYEELL